MGLLGASRGGEAETLADLPKGCTFDLRHALRCHAELVSDLAEGLRFPSSQSVSSLQDPAFLRSENLVRHGQETLDFRGDEDLLHRLLGFPVGEEIDDGDLASQGRGRVDVDGRAEEWNEVDRLLPVHTSLLRKLFPASGGLLGARAGEEPQ